MARERISSGRGKPARQVDQKGFDLDGGLPENVEIVHLTQKILQIFKILAPSRVQGRQEILDRVAKTLYPNAQIVKGNVGAVAGGPAVEYTSFLPTLESEVSKHGPISRYTRGTTGQFGHPSLPLSRIEVLQGGGSSLLQFRFLCGHKISESLGGCIARGCEMFDPLLHHMGVAQVAQAAEELLAGFSHLLPGWIGIENHDAVGERPTPAEGSAKIVNRLGAEVHCCLVALVQNLLHPVCEPDTSLHGGGLSHTN